jgi:hypothetical protein
VPVSNRFKVVRNISEQAFDTVFTFMPLQVGIRRGHANLSLHLAPAEGHQAEAWPVGARKTPTPGRICPTWSMQHHMNACRQS